MSEAELLPDVRRFIIDHVNSVDQLETLLLLHAQPTKKWSAGLVSSELRNGVDAAALRLAELKALGIASEVAAGVFQFAPATRMLAETIDELSTAYKERRVSVITLIYNKPARDAQAFSDAFRLKKKEGP